MSTAVLSAASPTRSRRRGIRPSAIASPTAATVTAVRAVSQPYSPQTLNGESRESWKPSVRSAKSGRPP